MEEKNGKFNEIVVGIVVEQTPDSPRVRVCSLVSHYSPAAIKSPERSSRDRCRTGFRTLLMRDRELVRTGLRTLLVRLEDDAEEAEEEVEDCCDSAVPCEDMVKADAVVTVPSSS